MAGAEVAREPNRGVFSHLLRGAMIELQVHNEKGEVTGSVRIDEAILGDKVRPRLLHQVAVAYMANRRQGTSSAKTKAECAGSNKKPWAQKHTGRARHGDRRSPIWVGGGVAHPPKPRDYRQHLTRSMRREALRSALLSKLIDKQVTVIEPPEFETPRTKRVASMLKALGLPGGSLIALAKPNEAFWKSSRNVPRLRVMVARDLNALEVLACRRLVLARDVVDQLPEILR